jgi:hypothetical protein
MGYVCWVGAAYPLRMCKPLFLPLQDSIGDVCPKGHYCPTGTSVPQRCPTGTFSNNTGNVAAANCTACLAGWQCDTTGLVVPVNPCNATYYCPTGTVTPTLLCTPGSYCAGGNAAPVPCDAGTYTNTTGRASCLTCPASVYCPAGTSLPLACPAGYYCSGGSSTGLETPCAAGTYSALQRLSLASQCTICPSGWYCQSPGITTPTAQCSAGFYCTGGSTVAAPTVGFSMGYVCSTLSGYGLGCPAYFNRTSNVSYGPSSLYVALSAAPVGVGDMCPLGHYCPVRCVRVSVGLLPCTRTCCWHPNATRTTFPCSLVVARPHRARRLRLSTRR